MKLRIIFNKNIKNLCLLISNIKIIDFIKNFVKTFFMGLFLKIKDLFYLMVAFFIIIVAYSSLMGVEYKTFTSEQIDELIKKEVLITDYTTVKYLVDIKGYGNKDLIVHVSPNTENIKISDFNRTNFNGKIYIFSEIQKTPLESFIFSSKIYKREFSFEFPFASLKKLRESGWVFPSYNAAEYQLYIRNISMSKLNFIKEKSKFSTKHNLIIEGKQYRNHGLIYSGLVVVNYDVGGYTLKPLLDKDAFDLCKKPYSFGKERCPYGISNITLPVYKNGVIEYQDFTLIESNLFEVFHVPNNVDGEINLYLHNNDALNQEYLGHFDSVGHSYIKYICTLQNGNFGCPTFGKILDDNDIFTGYLEEQ